MELRGGGRCSGGAESCARPVVSSFNPSFSAFSSSLALQFIISTASKWFVILNPVIAPTSSSHQAGNNYQWSIAASLYSVLFITASSLSIQQRPRSVLTAFIGQSTLLTRLQCPTFVGDGAPSTLMSLARFVKKKKLDRAVTLSLSYIHVHSRINAATSQISITYSNTCLPYYQCPCEIKQHDTNKKKSQTKKKQQKSNDRYVEVYVPTTWWLKISFKECQWSSSTVGKSSIRPIQSN